jgi:hypothetical protein
MKQYFRDMKPIGRPLKDKQKEKMQDNALQVREVESLVAKAVEEVKNAGIPAEKVRARGEQTGFDRLQNLVDPGTWLPLNSIYDPAFNEEGSTGVINGIGKISGRYASIIASDNKVLAGAWIPGQMENIFPRSGCGGMFEHSAGLGSQLFRGQADPAGGGLRGAKVRRAHFLPARGIDPKRNSRDLRGFWNQPGGGRVSCHQSRDRLCS